ncbi:chemotaxis protein CheW [Pseudanabaena sp. FACHB-1998]|uniref:chemotaxis protein CheW n=1 Tax=Pseudanabaena sp. FACHB-1998 TaxID=2692858 RepID=UPI00168014DB|nr:chemotaxis protein CheW [Pseudanabaena sp. FACHB-1998]MBD2176396.1 chemotaxis protein CheW [Pseudanabaena sp. FACHB-1998]
MSNLTIELREEQSQAIAGLPYLSLQLERNVTVAVQLKIVRETLVLPAERFTQMPNVHHCLMGLVEHRSNVFWVLDLPQLLGFTPLQSNALETHLAILQIGGAFLGLGVHRIGRVMRFSETEIVSPQELPQTATPIEAIPFLRGWVNQDEGDFSHLYVLDAEAIACHNFSA